MSRLCSGHVGSVGGWRGDGANALLWVEDSGNGVILVARFFVMVEYRTGSTY